MSFTTFINTIPANGKWTNFIQNHKRGNIFQTHEMYKVYTKTRNYLPILITVFKSDRIVGVLLAVIIKENGIVGNLLTKRSIVFGGPIVEDNNLDILQTIVQNYSKHIRCKAIYTQFRNQWEWTNSEKEIFEQYGFTYQEHLDIIHDLVNKEVLWVKIHKGRRKNIKRAEKNNLSFFTVSSKCEFEEALTLIHKTYQRIKLPIPDLSLFLFGYEILIKTNKIKIFVAKYNDQIIASRIVLCFNSLIYDWYAGAEEKFLDKYPNDFLPWKIMEWGIENGYKYFDFGGAGKPNIPYGVRDYKLKFGGKLIEPGRYEKIHKPILFWIGKLGLKFYKLIS